MLLRSGRVHAKCAARTASKTNVFCVKPYDVQSGRLKQLLVNTGKDAACARQSITIITQALPLVLVPVLNQEI
jgi:hypothetical protein